MGFFGKHAGKAGTGASGDYTPKHAGKAQDRQTRARKLKELPTYQFSTPKPRLKKDKD
jgi:hypothetical protein